MFTGKYVRKKQYGTECDVQIRKCDKCGIMQYVDGDEDCKDFVQLIVTDMCHFVGDPSKHRRTPYEGKDTDLCGNCMLELEAWLQG